MPTDHPEPTEPVDQYVVVDIGCIECGCSSEIVAVCGTRDQALDALAAYGTRIGHAVEEDDGEYSMDYFDGGQHSVRILEAR